jgi:hypothetical protein
MLQGQILLATWCNDGKKWCVLGWGMGGKVLECSRFFSAWLFDFMFTFQSADDCKYHVFYYVLYARGFFFLVYFGGLFEVYLITV